MKDRKRFARFFGCGGVVVRGRPMAVGVLLLFAAVVPAPGASASHDDGVFDMPTIVAWDTFHLDVVLVPPFHGPLSGGNASEVDPLENSYRRAITAALDHWRQGIDEYGAPWLAENLSWNVLVVGDPTIAPGAATDAEIIIVHSEVGSFGFATSTYNLCTYYISCSDGHTCVIHAGPLPAINEGVARVRNVHAHEFGHCLGLGHPGGDGAEQETYHPVEDVMAYGPNPMEFHCVSNLDVLGLEAAFGSLVGLDLPTTATINVTEYEQLDCNGNGERFRYPEEHSDDTEVPGEDDSKRVPAASASLVGLLLIAALGRRRLS